MLLATYTADAHSECCVELQSPNADVLALSTVYMTDINYAEFWLKTDVTDHPRYIPVHDAASQKLVEKMCRALLAFHAITGCDSTSAPTGIGKGKG